MFKPTKLYLIKSPCNCNSTGIESLKPQSVPLTPPGWGRKRVAAELIKKGMLNIPIKHWRNLAVDHFHISHYCCCRNVARWKRSPQRLHCICLGENVLCVYRSIWPFPVLWGCCMTHTHTSMFLGTRGGGLGTTGLRKDKFTIFA